MHDVLVLCNDCCIFLKGRGSVHGISLHGISVHGISLHGISVHGISVHGISLHGISLHGWGQHDQFWHGDCIDSRSIHFWYALLILFPNEPRTIQQVLFLINAFP